MGRKNCYTGNCRTWLTNCHRNSLYPKNHMDWFRFSSYRSFRAIGIGLYLEKGNSMAATLSIIFGLVFSTYNLLVELGVDLPTAWEIASVQQAAYGMIGSALIFIIVSLVTKKEQEKAENFINTAGMLDKK